MTNSKAQGPNHAFRKNIITKAFKEPKVQLTTAEREKLNAESKKKIEDWLAIKGNEIEVIPSSQSNAHYNPAGAKGAWL
jgi:ribosome maturation protein Sdo1